MVMGLIQSLIICGRSAIVRSPGCKSPAAFIFLEDCSFLCICEYYLCFLLHSKHIGKAVSVILVIIQIPGSAGTYPIEMTPAFSEAASAASFYIRESVCDERSGSRNIWIPLCRESVVSCSVCSDCAFDPELSYVHGF